MLVLPEFQLAQPQTIEEAVEALVGGPDESMALAGGTDLLPNLKHGLYSPRRVVSLRRVSALREVTEVDGGLFLGAGLTLSEMSSHLRIRAMYPALADAAGLVAGPQLRNMGTLGGNICLETRCVYYNQTFFWRDALGYCIKKDGDECHVIPGGSRCVAAFSADTPGPLLVYGATVHMRSVRGEREVPTGEFFRADGLRNTVREPDELVTGVTLPAPAPGLQSSYFKFRIRNSIDFPALSVAAAARMDDGRFQSLDLVVGALGARPRVVKRAEELVRGERLTPELAEELGGLAFQQCHPLSNINVDSEWRRDVLPVFVQRTLENLKPSTS